MLKEVGYVRLSFFAKKYKNKNILKKLLLCPRDNVVYCNKGGGADGI